MSDSARQNKPKNENLVVDNIQLKVSAAVSSPLVMAFGCQWHI